MQKIRTIAAAELKTLFYSPIAWFILVLFAVQTAAIFTTSMKASLQFEIMGQRFPNKTVSATRFSDTLGFIYLYLPLLTMGLMSREKSSGSIKLLYSSPISNTQIILGKFLSMLLYGLVLTGVMASFGVFAAFAIKDIDFPVVLTSLIGIYLLIAIYAAIGLFISCLTSYQVAAALGTVALLAGLRYINTVWQGIAFVRDITYWLSITGRTGNLLNGLINSEDILYFVVIITLFITLSVLKLNSERFKRSQIANIARYVLVIVVAMGLGYITSRPAMMRYYDVTRNKRNTLTVNSQVIVRHLSGPLTITTYVNLFERNATQALPEQINFDKEHFNEYHRFKPDIDLKYVYYYAQTDQPSLIATYPGLTDRQRLERACLTYDLNPDIFLSEEQLRKQIDLSGEHFHFIRVLGTQDGKKGYLRLFNDLSKQPGEREITATLKRIAMKLPTVGFIKGHGSRDIQNDGDKGYTDFTTDNATRTALINQGFDVRPLDLSDTSPIPPEINILVLADMKTALSNAEDAKLSDYTELGGNLLLIGEPGRQNILNPIAAKLGVDFLQGRLVQPGNNYSADIIAVRPTKPAVAMSYELKNILDNDGVVTMNGACGLGYIQNKGFTVTPWLVTAPTGSWNELKTTDVPDETPVLDAPAREKQTSFPTMLALTRQIGAHQQRIAVMGDADCLDNAELTARRKGIISMNGTLISSLFYWLSDGQVPIDVRRTPLTDNEIKLTLSGMAKVRWFFVWIMPGLLGVFGTLLLARRRSQ